LYFHEEFFKDFYYKNESKYHIKFCILFFKKMPLEY